MAIMRFIIYQGRGNLLFDVIVYEQHYIQVTRLMLEYKDKNDAYMCAE